MHEHDSATLPPGLSGGSWRQDDEGDIVREGTATAWLPGPGGRPVAVGRVRVRVTRLPLFEASEEAPHA